MRFILALLTIILLSSCLTEAGQQNGADKIVASLHQAILANDWDKAANLYSKDFFKQESREHWQHHFKELEKGLGKIEGFKISSKHKDPRYGGDFYIYSVFVQQDHGYSNETITIFSGLDNNQLKITGYKIIARKHQ